MGSFINGMHENHTRRAHWNPFLLLRKSRKVSLAPHDYWWRLENPEIIAFQISLIFGLAQFPRKNLHFENEDFLSRKLRIFLWHPIYLFYFESIENSIDCFFRGHDMIKIRSSRSRICFTHEVCLNQIEVMLNIRNFCAWHSIKCCFKPKNQKQIIR